jgi:hypothetical protein
MSVRKLLTDEEEVQLEQCNCSRMHHRGMIFAFFPLLIASPGSPALMDSIADGAENRQGNLNLA